MRKWIFGILCIVGLCVLGLIVMVASDFIRGEKPPADLATRPWVEHKFYMDLLEIDVPWELTPMPPSEGANIPDGRLDTCRRDGVEVLVGVSHASGFGNLDNAMDDMARLLKETRGIKILSETRKEESILGGRAIVLYLSVQDNWWRKTDIRILIFKFHDRLYQVHCDSPMGDPTGDKIWERLRKSIRHTKSAGLHPESIKRNPPLIPPEGMRRR